MIAVQAPGWNRSGVTLPELVLVAWLFALVLLALAEFAGAQSRLVGATHDGIRRTEVIRTTDLVLGREVRSLTVVDMAPLPPDGVRLRAVRGSGPLCPGARPSELLVRYRGTRRPDPEKDSLLLVGASFTGGVAYAVRAVAADTACGGGMRITPDRPASAVRGFVLVYESGEYSLADGALRYRRGAGGRQPLTEAVLDGGGITATPAGLALAIRFHPDSLPRADSGVSLTVHRVNRPVP